MSRVEPPSTSRSRHLSDPPSATVGRHDPVTPDGRYFVVRGRLWRCTNPALPVGERKRLTSILMAARRAVGTSRRQGDAEGLDLAHAAVDAAKTGLGERGPVWWDDGAPDCNRRMARHSPYAAWYAAIGTEGPDACSDAPSGIAPEPRVTPS